MSTKRIVKHGDFEDCCEEHDGCLPQVAQVGDPMLPDPKLLQYYILRGERCVFLNGDIEDDALDIIMLIREWNMEDFEEDMDDRSPIKIFINSDGGDANVVMALIDAISTSNTPVFTIGMGRVYSAGGLLLMAGHMRYVFEHTVCLIHDGSAGAAGSTAKMFDSMEYTKKLEAKTREYILDRTKISPRMMEQNYRRDWFLFSEDMLELGIADKIIADIDEIL